jgi:hypothetical protein
MSDTAGADARDPVDTLDAAAADIAAAEERLDDRGPETVRRVASLYEDVVATLDRYEDRATDWDDFEGYARFREALGEHVEGIDDDLPEAVREAVEAVDDILVTSGVAETLSAEDFERAREALAPLRECAELRADREDARERYRQARARVVDRLDDARARVDRLERVASFADVDFAADLSTVRDPVEAYNDAVAADVSTLVSERPAREALDALAAAARSPFVAARDPPADLRAHVEADPAGAESLATLREWVGYSPSKLDHYVEDAAAFRRDVGAAVSYLEALDAEPFRVGWPPAPGDRLPWQCRELESAIRPFAREETVARLREVRLLPRETDYDRLRRVAVARERLDEADRERLRDGGVEADLADAREERARLADALDEHPPVEKR